MPKAAKETKSKNVIVVYDYDLNDLPKAIATIAELNQKKEKLATEANERILSIQTKLAEEIEPIEVEIKKVSLSIKKFSDENKEKLFSKDSKTAKLETGEICYRAGKPSVETKSSPKLIENILKKNSLTEKKEKFVKLLSGVFIRVKFELNKDAILENPTTAEKVTGVKVDTGEDRFYITPTATNTEMEVE